MKHATVVGYTRYNNTIRLYVTIEHHVNDLDCKGVRVDEVTAYSSELPHPDKIVGKDIKFYTTFTQSGKYVNRYAFAV